MSRCNLVVSLVRSVQSGSGNEKGPFFFINSRPDRRRVRLGWSITLIGFTVLAISTKSFIAIAQEHSSPQEPPQYNKETLISIWLDLNRSPIHYITSQEGGAFDFSANRNGAFFPPENKISPWRLVDAWYMPGNGRSTYTLDGSLNYLFVFEIYDKKALKLLDSKRGMLFQYPILDSTNKAYRDNFCFLDIQNYLSDANNINKDIKYQDVMFSICAAGITASDLDLNNSNIQTLEPSKENLVSAEAAKQYFSRLPITQTTNFDNAGP